MWSAQYKDEFPHRYQDPLVTLTNGKRICVTRLVGPTDIPFERNKSAEFLIRRFVSMIPIYQYADYCTKLNGIWLTNDVCIHQSNDFINIYGTFFFQQILSILSASAKDLGILLVCYYLSLGFRAFLVMGFALPNGDTTFVATKENGEYFLIDPFTGKKYSAKDTGCPLTKVYCMVNSDNVGGNVFFL